MTEVRTGADIAFEGWGWCGGVGLFGCFVRIKGSQAIRRCGRFQEGRGGAEAVAASWRGEGQHRFAGRECDPYRIGAVVVES